jgi:glutaminase
MTLDVHALADAVTSSHARFGALPGGGNASYIPYLASVPSHLAGLAVVTVDGRVFAAGDTSYPFAIESISKVMTLALILEQRGPDLVQKQIGADPTGLPFNSVTALELHGDRPLSPLVNAGAIASVSLVDAHNAEDRWQQILAMQGALAGRAIAMSEVVNHSEQTTNFHNRAIAWLLYAAGTLYCDAMEACDVYTRQCSTLITCLDLATMGATLAAGGVNPVTKNRVLDARHVPPILAEMTMEGLYERSGDWAYTVGLPGKSGVGGGIVAVMPGVAAIAGFAPPLDAAGNSVRGQAMVSAVAQALGWNIYNVPARA